MVNSNRSRWFLLFLTPTAAFILAPLPTKTQHNHEIKCGVRHGNFLRDSSTCKRNLHILMQENRRPEQNHQLHRELLSIPLSFSIWSAGADIASAKDGNFGVLETSWAGMLHPVGMFVLYGVTIAAAYHGFQWRRTRTMSQEINALKANGAPESEIAAAQKLRSELSAAGHREQHTALGYLLLAAGVALAVEGGLSTWFRVGELFPGPHVFAGAAAPVAWAAAAGLVPWMAKGSEAARAAHVALNLGGFLLFTWQIVTGWEIAVNVFNAVPGW